MKKVIVGLFLLLFIAVGIGFYYVYNNLDELIKAAIEKYGSEVTHTAVRVDKVKLDLKQGSGSVQGFRVGNLPGYADPNIFSLGEISTRIDYESVRKEVIIIDSIAIVAPQVFFEMNADNKANLIEMNNLISKTQGAGKTTPGENAKSGTGEEPRLIIRHVRFAEGSIQARLTGINDKIYPLKLPPLEMKDLGGKSGATVSEIVKQILKKLSDQAITAVKQQGLYKELDKLKAQMQEKLDKEKAKFESNASNKLDAQKQKATDKLKSLLSK